MNVLEIAGLRKRFRDRIALAGIDLTLEEGMVLGLVGPNEAGKTTLIKSVLGLVHPDAGSVTVFGTDILRSGTAVRGRIGFVHEQCWLPERFDPDTLGRFLSLAYTGWSHSAWKRHLGRFGVPGDTRIGALSKGMKMRLALAVALSHQAELILLDEPAAGLDPVARRETLEIVGEELRSTRCSFIISTHITGDLDRIADMVTVIDRGHIGLTFRRDDLADSWAVCSGPKELVKSIPDGLLIGVENREYGFTALTKDRFAVRRALGDRVVIERATIEDVLVHTMGGGVA